MEPGDLLLLRSALVSRRGRLAVAVARPADSAVSPRLARLGGSVEGEQNTPGGSRRTAVDLLISRSCWPDPGVRLARRGRRGHAAAVGGGRSSPGSTTSAAAGWPAGWLADWLVAGAAGERGGRGWISSCIRWTTTAERWAARAAAAAPGARFRWEDENKSPVYACGSRRRRRYSHEPESADGGGGQTRSAQPAAAAA